MKVISINRLSLLALMVVLAWTGQPSAGQEPLPVPVLDCVVQCGYGFFDAYSSPPSPGDKAVLDLNLLMHSQDNATVQFLPVTKRSGPDYIVVQLPLKVASLDKRFDRLTCRVESLQKSADLSFGSRFDVRQQGQEDWLIYYVYEREGITAGVLVLSGTPHK